MHPNGIISFGAVTWATNILLTLVLAIIGFSARREIARNDEQEIRIRAVEQACVELKIMRIDISEMKGDIKTLVRKP